MTFGQLTCPALTIPQNNATNVPVESSISWTPVEGIPAYLISIGTTENGTDIVPQTNVGSTTTFTPPLGLPENIDVYITITLFFFDRDNVVCQSQQFRTEIISETPSCAQLTFPADGATNISTSTPVIWNYATKATGYRLTIGTSSGASDILDNQELGIEVRYEPIQNFPVNQEIFVSIIPINSIGATADLCNEYSFTTGSSVVLPQCTTLTTPSDGAVNIPLTPLLEWPPVSGADGYIVSIGSSPFENDVLDNVAFVNNSTLVLDFEPNRTFFALIVPYNSSGEAIGCTQTTFSTILGCGPFLNNDGELVSLNPEINFPDLVSFCENEVPYTVSTDDLAEGFRWFKINDDETEELLSSTSEVALSEEGMYRYEAYNFASQAGNTVECVNSKEFSVFSSEIATNITLDVSGQNGNIRIAIDADGIGHYEYALDNIEGPFQDSTIFENVPIGSHTVYIRDKNGCGIVQETITPDLTLEGFPKFFTPNGDGINDYWQFIPLPDASEALITTIQIFDRYGTFLARIDSREKGWDGSFNGKLLPASDYWFKALGANKQEIKGHFTLKR